MFRSIISPLATLGLAISIALSGCSGGTEHPERPERAAVGGMVTYNGAPVDRATISFHPEAPDGKAAFATTDAEGTFVMGTFETRDGVIPGTYKVTITKTETTGPAVASEDDPNYNPNPPPSETKSLLPTKYSGPASSGLQIVVGPGGQKDVKFDLAD